MNNRNIGLVVAGMAGFGRAILEILGNGGRLPQSVARPTRERIRKTAETRDDAGLMKAAGIKRLRRQQRNVLLSEKGAFDDSRCTYPLVVSSSDRRLRGSMDAAARGTSAAMRIADLDPAGVRVFYGDREIKSFG